MEKEGEAADRRFPLPSSLCVLCVLCGEATMGAEGMRGMGWLAGFR